MKMLLNHAIVRMVPYEPHCTIHWEHYYRWQMYEQSILRAAGLGEMDHRQRGIQRDHKREFGYNMYVMHTMETRGKMCNPNHRYTDIVFRPRPITKTYWPSPAECFWSCTHPIQWTSKRDEDKEGYTPFYEHRYTEHGPPILLIRNDAHTSLRYSKRSGIQVAYMLMNKPMVFFQGKDEIDLPLPIYDTGDDPRELIDNVFPALIPAEEQYDRMVTWEEVLSGQYIPDPEIGFHTVFGEVDPTWYMEWYKQLRRKH